MDTKKLSDDLENALSEEITKDEATEETSEEPKVPEKIKIGDKEYTQEELDSLIDKGNLAKEIEEKQNVSLKELYPEFTRKSQLLKDPAKLRDYLTEQFGEETEDKKKAEDDGGEIPDEVQKQITQARKLGFLTKEDVAEIVEKAVNAASPRIKAEMKLNTRLDELEKIYDGTDKAPSKVKFNRDAVLDYMIENFSGAKRVPDPETIFKLMNLGSMEKTAPTKEAPEDRVPPAVEKPSAGGVRSPKGTPTLTFKDEDKMREYLIEEFGKEQQEI